MHILPLGAQVRTNCDFAWSYSHVASTNSYVWQQGNSSSFKQWFCYTQKTLLWSWRNLSYTYTDLEHLIFTSLFPLSAWRSESEKEKLVYNYNLEQLPRRIISYAMTTHSQLTDTRRETFTAAKISYSAFKYPTGISTSDRALEKHKIHLSFCNNPTVISYLAQGGKAFYWLHAHCYPKHTECWNHQQLSLLWPKPEESDIKKKKI